MEDDKNLEPMSSSYADGLSPYDNKGKLGQKELFDSKEEVLKKAAKLAQWILESKHVVVHTGAGISTSAGIPDFRGPKGVWTLEEKGLKPDVNVSFNKAIPTKTHMALVKLVDSGMVSYVISQNIDGLHLKSGIPRNKISELHGNMFVEQCNQCQRLFVRKSATTSVGQRCLGQGCPAVRSGGRSCRGKVQDTILDWEHNLPERELNMADWHASMADLSLALGTTMQVVPSGNLPIQTKKRGGRLVICNLQPTKHDRKADLLIHTYVDEVMEEVLNLLDLELPDFRPDRDLTQKVKRTTVEWTITPREMQCTRKLYTEMCNLQTKRRKSSPTKVNKKSKVEKEHTNSTIEGSKVRVKNVEPFSSKTKNETICIAIKTEEKCSEQPLHGTHF